MEFLLHSFCFVINRISKSKLKKILFVAIAFGLFAVHTIISRLDLFMPDIESSLLELMLAITSFIALSLFFLAIVRKDKVVRKSASMQVIFPRDASFPFQSVTAVIQTLNEDLLIHEKIKKRYLVCK